MGSTERTSLALVDKRLESVTLNVMAYCPEIVGVPLRTPSAAKWIPGGSVPPATDQA